MIQSNTELNVSRQGTTVQHAEVQSCQSNKEHKDHFGNVAALTETMLVYKIRCWDGTNLKLIACAAGHKV